MHTHTFSALLALLALLPSLSLATSSLRWAQRATDNSTSALRPVSLAPRASSYSAIGAYCDSEFFSVQHFNESGAGPWYAEWVYNQIHHNASDWESRVSEPQYFALKTLHLMDLDCGVTHKGCINMPNCEEILERVGGNMTMARNIYYILQSFHNMNLVTGVASEQTLAAETNLLGMSGSMANTFFWKWDPKQQEKCDMVVNVIKSIEQATTVAIMTAIPAIGPIETVAELTAEEARASKALSATRVSSNWVSAMFRRQKSWVSGANAIRLNGLPPLKAKKPDWAWTKAVPYSLAKGWNNYVQPQQWQLVPQILTAMPMIWQAPALTDGVCKLFPNPTKDAVAGYIQQLDMTMQKVGRGYRKQIGSVMADLNRGIGPEENGGFDPDRSTLLSEQIILGHFAALTPREHEKYVNNPSIMEEMMTETFKNSLISAALKSQMCHLHCTAAAPGHENDCAFWTEAGGADLSKSRFCPRPGVVCQAQCWRNSKHSKVMELYGVKELTSDDSIWNFDFGSFLQDSYDHWQDHRGQPDQMFPSVDDLLNDQVVDPFGSFLPVCYDEHSTPLNFFAYEKSIPCTCGDRYGNETAMFFKAAGFESWVGLQDDRTKLGQECMRNMLDFHVPPVDQFMTFCELGVHWPVHGDNHHQMFLGRGTHCDDTARLIDELEGKGMDNEGVQCSVCFDSDVGRHIQEDQRDFVRGRSWWRILLGIEYRDNMKQNCHSWATKYRGKEPPCTLTEEKKKRFRYWAEKPWYWPSEKYEHT